MLRIRVVVVRILINVTRRNARCCSYPQGLRPRGGRQGNNGQAVSCIVTQGRCLRVGVSVLRYHRASTHRGQERRDATGPSVNVQGRTVTRRRR